MRISLIHPSRSRPARSWQTVNDWVNRAGCEVEVILSIDVDDPQKQEYIDLYQSRFQVLIDVNRSAVDAINKAATWATGDVFIVVSDDFTCPKNWALILEKHLMHKKDYVLKVNDGVQNYIVTLPIMHRDYYNRFGYIYHPGYGHMFADTELTHVADVLKRLVIRNDILFRHNHYSVLQPALRGKKDEVTLRADATWDHGKRLYLQRVKEKFGLGKDVDVMALSGEGKVHMEWLKRAGI